MCSANRLAKNTFLLVRSCSSLLLMVEDWHPLCSEGCSPLVGMASVAVASFTVLMSEIFRAAIQSL